MSIWSHSIVMNEDRYIWFSIMSVIDYMDKMLIWDTGSTDATTKIIKSIMKKYPSKIIFREVGAVTPLQLTQYSQEMLERTKSDWILLLDGDEVWWEDSIRKLLGMINKNKNAETLVQPYYNIIGDIYHYQEEEAGMYEFDGRKGHLTIRAMSTKIPGLHFAKEHGQRGLYDGKGILVQLRNNEKRLFLANHYMHFTNMPRSIMKEKDILVPKRAFKFKYELGISFPKDFYYPEVFFIKRPSMIISPWQKNDNIYMIRALLETPLKKIKRRISPVHKSGY